MKKTQQMFFALARGENLSMKTNLFYVLYLPNFWNSNVKLYIWRLMLIHTIISTETLPRKSYPIVVVLENLVKLQLVP